MATTATGRVEVELVATDKASKPIEQVNRKLTDLGGVAKKTATPSIGELDRKIGGFIQTAFAGSLTIAAFGMILKGAFDLLKRAEEISDAKAALTVYTGSAEAAAFATKAVRDASDGMLSSFDATRAATRLFSMGLAENAIQAAEVTRIAVTLGDAFGKEAGPAIEDFSNMLSTGRIMGLKDYGISMKEVRTRAQELARETGNLDERTALAMATMEVAREKLGELEAQGYKAGDATTRFNSAIQDLIDFGIVVFSDRAAPAVEVMGDFARGALDAAEANKILGVTSEDFNEDMTEVFYDLQNGARVTYGELLLMRDALTWTGVAGYEASTGLYEMADGATYTFQQLFVMREELATTYSSMSLATEGLLVSLEDLQLFVKGPLGKEFDTFTKKNETLEEKAADVQTRVDELNGMSWLTDEQRTELDENKQKLADIQQQIKDNAAEHSLATKQIVFDLLVQRASVDELTSEESRLLLEVAENWGLIDTKTKEATLAIDGALVDLAAGDGFETVLAKIDEIQFNAEDAAGTYQIGFDVIYRGGSGGYYDPRKGTYVVEGQRAEGGDVMAGKSYLVGENRRAELFVPGQNGHVYPIDEATQYAGGSNGAGWSGGDLNVNVVLSSFLSLAETRDAQDKIAPIIRREVERAIRESRQ